MQALLRTMFRAAAQRYVKAGTSTYGVISRAESGRTGTALEILEFSFQCKEKYGRIFEKHEEVLDQNIQHRGDVRFSIGVALALALPAIIGLGICIAAESIILRAS
jgi:hypothetical protein